MTLNEQCQYNRLSNAIRIGHPDTISSISFRDLFLANKDRFTIAHMVASYGHLSIIDPDFVNECLLSTATIDGWSVAHAAAAVNLGQISIAMLSPKVLDLRTKNGSSVAYVAWQWGNIEQIPTAMLKPELFLRSLADEAMGHLNKGPLLYDSL